MTRVFNKHSLVGKEDRDVFEYLGSDRILRTQAKGGVSLPRTIGIKWRRASSTSPALRHR
jgi:hypothetical protein